MLDGGDDHVRTEADEQFAQHPHARAIADDAEGNHEGYEHQASPRAVQEQVGGQDAGDEQHSAGADAAALMGEHESGVGQLEP